MIATTLQEFFQLLSINKPIIAIDHGEKKIGIAISNQEQTISMPLKTIYAIKEQDKINAILELISTYSVCAIVLGLPISLNGNYSDQTNITLKFGEKFSLSTNLPIYLQDERLTSKLANNLLKSIGISRRKRNQKDDAIAASLILETTLNSMKRF